MTDYLLDANVFIQAKNLHYGFDICPGFWDWLVKRNGAGSVASIEKVADELRVGDDDLAAWAQERGDSFFLRPDGAVAAALPAVSDWAVGADYEPAAAATFLQVADYWLVAHALAHDCIVVTHEVPADTIRKIKIPNACIGLGLRCMTHTRCCGGSVRGSCWSPADRLPPSPGDAKPPPLGNDVSRGSDFCHLWCVLKAMDKSASLTFVSRET